MSHLHHMLERFFLRIRYLDVMPVLLLFSFHLIARNCPIVNILWRVESFVRGMRNSRNFTSSLTPLCWFSCSSSFCLSILSCFCYTALSSPRASVKTVACCLCRFLAISPPCSIPPLFRSHTCRFLFIALLCLSFSHLACLLFISLDNIIPIYHFSFCSKCKWELWSDYLGHLKRKGEACAAYWRPPPISLADWVGIGSNFSQPTNSLCRRVICTIRCQSNSCRALCSSFSSILHFFFLYFKLHFPD